MYRYNYAGHDDARRLVAAGDSFVWGCVTKPPYYRGRRGPQQAEPFTEILAKHLGLNYAELGLRGASNWDIYKHLMLLELQQSDLVLVVWSGPARHNRYHDTEAFYSTMWIEAIKNVTEHLDHVGCEYYYLSSFQDYRLSAPEPLPESCTKNWLWYNDAHSTLYDLCVKSNQSGFVKQGEFEHNHGSFPDTGISIEEYRYLSKKFAMTSKYITGCHHPSQEGHEMLASLLHKQLATR